MASGIKDKVAILGMGCSKFGERWDREADDLMVEAFEEALSDAGIETKQINAAWSRASRTTALAAPKPFAAPSTPSRQARPTSRSPWAARS
jgi:acetyl-CoA acetyltransferase